MKLLLLCCTMMLLGCFGQNRFASAHQLSKVKSVDWEQLGQDNIRIEDSSKINSIISILNKARQTPVKFIAREKMIFTLANGEKVELLKYNEVIRLEGITFVLRKKQLNQLQALLKQ